MGQQAQDGSILTDGMFGSGFFAGGMLIGGRGWVPDVETYLVYRGLGETFDDDPVGLAEEGDSTVTIEGQGLAPADGIEYWQYHRRGVSPGGSMGAPSVAVVVAVDDEGVMQVAVGNEPASLTARNVWNGAGVIELRWIYDSENQPAVPTGFKIYIKNGAVWDYVDSVVYHAGGTPNYRWRSEAHSHGLEVEYKVVTYRTVSEIDYETDGPTVTITADAQGPLAVTELEITIIDE